MIAAIRTFLVVLFTVTHAEAQRGSLRVRVQDAGGRDVTARVLVGRPVQGAPRAVHVDEDRWIDGSVTFELAPGGVEVVVVPDRPGAITRRRRVQVTAHRTIELDVVVDAKGAWTRRDPAPTEETRPAVEPGDAPSIDGPPAELVMPPGPLWIRDAIRRWNDGERNDLRPAGRSGARTEPAIGLSWWTCDGQDLLTNGPLLSWWVNGSVAGETTVPANGLAHVRLRLEAEPLVDVDTVLVLVNGDVEAVLQVPGSDGRVRLDTRVRIPMDHDGWISIVAFGDAPLPKLFTIQDPHERPFVASNPIWIDGNGDGVVESRLKKARAAASGWSDASDVAKAWGPLGAHARATVVRALTPEMEPSIIRVILVAGLHDASPVVRADAIRALSRLGVDTLHEELAFATSLAEDPGVNRAFRERAAPQKEDSP